MSLSEMLLADSAGSAADKNTEVIRAARQEREARRAPGAVQQSLCVHTAHCTTATRPQAQTHNHT